MHHFTFYFFTYRWYLHYWINTGKGYETIFPKIYNHFQMHRRWQNRNRTHLTNPWLLVVIIIIIIIIIVIVVVVIIHMILLV